MAKSLFVGISHNEIQLDPNFTNPDISDNIQQTIARLEGWNEATNKFNLLRSDNVGRLLVSLAPPQAPFVNQTAVVVVAAEALILPANQNRRLYIIQNQDINPIFISYTAGFVIGRMIEVASGTLWSDDLWNGDVFAHCTAGLTAACAIWEY